jgi:hypothetical protein
MLNLQRILGHLPILTSGAHRSPKSSNLFALTTRLGSLCQILLYFGVKFELFSLPDHRLFEIKSTVSIPSTDNIKDGCSSAIEPFTEPDDSS